MLCQTAAKSVISFFIQMKPTTIQMTCFNFFAVINEVKVLSVTHFFQVMVDFTSPFIQFRLIRSYYN